MVTKLYPHSNSFTMNKLTRPEQYAASIRGFFASGVPMYESIRYGGGSPRTAFDTFLVQMRSLLGTTSPFSDSVKSIMFKLRFKRLVQIL